MAAARPGAAGGMAASGAFQHASSSVLVRR